MYPVLHVDDLLAGQVRVGGRVANGKEAGKLVSFGGVDFLFHVLGFLFYGDV